VRRWSGLRAPKIECATRIVTPIEMNESATLNAGHVQP
jgi:hypothetical protein